MAFWGVLYQPLQNLIQITEESETWQANSLKLVSQNAEISNSKNMKWRHNDVIIVFL